MAISKEALNFRKEIGKNNSNRRVSKYLKYEDDILYLKKEGTSVSKIADFLEETYNLPNDKSLTALQSFIKVREKRDRNSKKNIVVEETVIKNTINKDDKKVPNIFKNLIS